MSWLKALALFLGLLTDIIRGAMVKHEHEERQESSDAISSDPAGEFISRFGVRNKSDTDT
jgi:hypothetical protein